MMLKRIGEKLDTNLIRHEDIVDKVEKELKNRRFLRVYKHTTKSQRSHHRNKQTKQTLQILIS